MLEHALPTFSLDPFCQDGFQKGCEFFLRSGTAPCGQDCFCEPILLGCLDLVNMSGLRILIICVEHLVQH